MELVEGAPLSAVLARKRRLDPERVLDVVSQAALALGAAHRAGVVHRDVKPSNLVIRPDGMVKVTDFGIARTVGEVPQSEIGLVVGTAAYLSPEKSPAGRPRRQATSTRWGSSPTNALPAGGRSLPRTRLRWRSPISAIPRPRCRPMCRNRCVRWLSGPWQRMPGPDHPPTRWPATRSWLEPRC